MEQMQRQQAEAFKKAQNGTATSAQNTTQNTGTAPKKDTPVEAEYIDFEEVKKK
jgi:hypothetical protein